MNVRFVAHGENPISTYGHRLCALDFMEGRTTNAGANIGMDVNSIRW